MSEPLTDHQLTAMERLAADGRDHEWGWYKADVPVLVAEVRRLRSEVTHLNACHDAAIGALHTARAALGKRDGSFNYGGDL